METNDLKAMTNAVIDGELNALEIYAQLKLAEKAVKTALDAVYAFAAEEADPYEKTFEKHGYTFEKRVGGASYNYKGIPAWCDKQVELKAIEERAKLAYSAYAKGQNLVSDDGEVSELPEVTYRKDSIVVKVKR